MTPNKLPPERLEEIKEWCDPNGCPNANVKVPRYSELLSHIAAVEQELIAASEHKLDAMKLITETQGIADALRAESGHLRDEILKVNYSERLLIANQRIEKLREAVQDHAEGGNIDNYGHLSDKLDAIAADDKAKGMG